MGLSWFVSIGVVIKHMSTMTLNSIRRIVIIILDSLSLEVPMVIGQSNGYVVGMNGQSKVVHLEVIKDIVI